MKKIIVILFLFVLLLSVYNNNKVYIIPSNSIRFRIIANSDGIEDQNLKITIKNNVEKELYKIIDGSNTVNEARKKIKNNIDKVKNILDSYNIKYNINYGNNYFPKKEYKGVLYEEGEYESLVITLDKGLGKNWWCVLFPPLCLLDEQEDNVKYDIYVKRIINKYL